jgi:hypothetical protein
MSMNFLHSCFPHWKICTESLDSEVPQSAYRELDLCEILLKNRKKKMLTVRVAELMFFQHSKFLDIDDDMYPISSHYKYFSLELHETNRIQVALISHP